MMHWDRFHWPKTNVWVWVDADNGLNGLGNVIVGRSVFVVFVYQKSFPCKLWPEDGPVGRIAREKRIVFMARQP